VTKRPQQQQQVVQWQPPPIGFVCNLDATICMTNNKVCVGACIHDEKSHFIAAMTSNKEGAMATSEAEA
jgi:hypothetical protein